MPALEASWPSTLSPWPLQSGSEAASSQHTIPATYVFSPASIETCPSSRSDLDHAPARGTGHPPRRFEPWLWCGQISFVASTCEECSFDWDCPAEHACDVIAELGPAYRARLERFIDASDQSAIRARPSPQIWSALEYAAHMRDVVAFYSHRIHRVLHEERPPLEAADFSSMPERLEYLEDDPMEVLDAIAVSARSIEQQLRELGTKEWGRVGIGVDGDERTTLTLARRLAHDGQHHLLGLDRIAEALLSAEPHL
jgi:hypothetical protein